MDSSADDWKVVAAPQGKRNQPAQTPAHRSRGSPSTRGRTRQGRVVVGQDQSADEEGEVSSPIALQATAGPAPTQPRASGLPAQIDTDALGWGDQMMVAAEQEQRPPSPLEAVHQSLMAMNNSQNSKSSSIEFGRSLLASTAAIKMAPWAKNAVRPQLNGNSTVQPSTERLDSRPSHPVAAVTRPSQGAHGEMPGSAPVTPAAPDSGLRASTQTPADMPLPGPVSAVLAAAPSAPRMPGISYKSVAARAAVTVEAQDATDASPARRPNTDGGAVSPSSRHATNSFVPAAGRQAQTQSARAGETASSRAMQAGASQATAGTGWPISPAGAPIDLGLSLSSLGLGEGIDGRDTGNRLAMSGPSGPLQLTSNSETAGQEYGQQFGSGISDATYAGSSQSSHAAGYAPSGIIDAAPARKALRLSAAAPEFVPEVNSLPAGRA